MMPLWVTEAASDFWTFAGEPATPPRELERPIALSLPLAIVALPRLRIASIDDWLRRRGIVCDVASANRPLRACLVARRGAGFIFLDGTDPAGERRFSLAHELAHFLRHYRQRREVVAARLGPEAIQALDGERFPTTTERLHGLLARVSLDYYVHLMDRAPSGDVEHPEIARAETEADLLAFELLAPSAGVLTALSELSADRRSFAAVRTLQNTYGLPRIEARRYARFLISDPEPASPFLRRLGLA